MNARTISVFVGAVAVIAVLVGVPAFYLFRRATPAATPIQNAAPASSTAPSPKAVQPVPLKAAPTADDLNEKLVPAIIDAMARFRGAESAAEKLEYPNQGRRLSSFEVGYADLLKTSSVINPVVAHVEINETISQHFEPLGKPTNYREKARYTLELAPTDNGRWKMLTASRRAELESDFNLLSVGRREEESDISNTAYMRAVKSAVEGN